MHLLCKGEQIPAPLHTFHSHHTTWKSLQMQTLEGKGHKIQGQICKRIEVPKNAGRWLVGLTRAPNLDGHLTPIESLLKDITSLTSSLLKVYRNQVPNAGIRTYLHLQATKYFLKHGPLRIGHDNAPNKGTLKGIRYSLLPLINCLC